MSPSEPFESEGAHEARTRYNERGREQLGGGAGRSRELRREGTMSEASWLQQAPPARFTTVQMPTPSGLVFLRVDDFYGHAAAAAEERARAAEALLRAQTAQAQMRRVSSCTRRLWHQLLVLLLCGSEEDNVQQLTSRRTAAIRHAVARWWRGDDLYAGSEWGGPLSLRSRHSRASTERTSMSSVGTAASGAPARRWRRRGSRGSTRASHGAAAAGEAAGRTTLQQLLEAHRAREPPLQRPAEVAKARATRLARLIEQRVEAELVIRRRWRHEWGEHVPGVEAEVAKLRATQQAELRAWEDRQEEGARARGRPSIRRVATASQLAVGGGVYLAGPARGASADLQLGRGGGGAGGEEAVQGGEGEGEGSASCRAAAPSSSAAPAAAPSAAAGAAAERASLGLVGPYGPMESASPCASLPAAEVRRRVSIAFAAHDRDRSGQMDAAELRGCLRHLGVLVPSAAGERLVARYDEDGDGLISELELHEIVSELAELQEEFEPPGCLDRLGYVIGTLADEHDPLSA